LLSSSRKLEQAVMPSVRAKAVIKIYLFFFI
jgi:hypothetical protein